MRRNSYRCVIWVSITERDKKGAQDQGPSGNSCMSHGSLKHTLNTVFSKHETENIGRISIWCSRVFKNVAQVLLFLRLPLQGITEWEKAGAWPPLPNPTKRCWLMLGTRGLGSWAVSMEMGIREEVPSFSLFSILIGTIATIYLFLKE